jgi:hypothetical protein
MRLRQLILGSRSSIAGVVYGTIVVLSSLIAGAKLYEHDLWHLCGIIATTVLVLWFAHVYSDGIGESLDLGRRLSVDELGSIARREWAIPSAAALPIAFVALGALGLLAGHRAVWLAFGAGVATLSMQGLRYALLERLSLFGTIFTVTLNIGIALLLVLLKVFVAH